MKTLYDGKTKTVLLDEENNVTHLLFKDSATGENGVFDPGSNSVGGSVEGKGKIGLAVSKYFFELMEKNIWITPTQAKEYGLIDEIVGLDGAADDPAAFVAAAGGRIRLTAAMRQKYLDHVAEEKTAGQKAQAQRALARIRALASY